MNNVSFYWPLQPKSQLKPLEHAECPNIVHPMQLCVSPGSRALTFTQQPSVSMRVSPSQFSLHCSSGCVFPTLRCCAHNQRRTASPRANEAGDRISPSEGLLGGEEIDSLVFVIRRLQALDVLKVHLRFGLMEGFHN